MPSTWNSASARRERSSACARSEPVTISLASSESNWPPTTEPAVDAGVDAHARARPGRRSTVTVPGAGRKLRPASSPLIRNSMECPRGWRVLPQVQLLALGDAELLADQVQPRGLLRDRVLDLQPGVDLQERDQPVLTDEELDGARAVVAGLLADRLGGVVDRRPLLVGQERRGRLLDELLEPPLQRAVPGADDDDVAVGVGEHLRLDVARLVQVALDEALPAAERGDGLADRGVVELADLLRAPARPSSRARRRRTPP